MTMNNKKVYGKLKGELDCYAKWGGTFEGTRVGKTINVTLHQVFDDGNMEMVEVLDYTYEFGEEFLMQSDNFSTKIYNRIECNDSLVDLGFAPGDSLSSALMD